MASSAMVKIYAELIIAGRKTIDEVPVQLREEVRAYLKELGYEV